MWDMPSWPHHIPSPFTTLGRLSVDHLGALVCPFPFDSPLATHFHFGTSYMPSDCPEVAEVRSRELVAALQPLLSSSKLRVILIDFHQSRLGQHALRSNSARKLQSTGDVRLKVNVHTPSTRAWHESLRGGRDWSDCGIPLQSST